MSNKHINAVWGMDFNTSGDKLVALAIADRANSDGKCWPSIEDISRRCGMSDRNVRKILRRLEESGVVSVLKNGGMKTKSGYTNLYIINIKGGNHSSGDEGNHSSPKPPVNPQLNPHNDNSEIALKALTTNYQDFISLSMTSTMADELTEYASKVKPDWVANAFKVAEAQNVRKWSYVRAILDSCITAGRWVDKRNGRAAANGTTGRRVAIG